MVTSSTPWRLRFPPRPCRCSTRPGASSLSPRRAHTPLTVAASNWVATALVVADEVPDAILIDMGSTTTDIIPIVGGVVRAIGLTDPDRLASGELVYTGALRTPSRR